MTKNYEMVSPRDFIGEILCDLAKENEKIVVLDSDLSSSVTTNKFADKYPERFFEMGIAEQNTMGAATGLALEGLIPFYVNFAIFVTGTVWTQLRQACYAKANVKLIGSHPGMDDGPDGATHHALEDLALSRVIPNLTIMNPIDKADLIACIKKAAEIDGPVYIRCARDIVPTIHEEKSNFELGKIEKIFDDGNDYAIVFEGTAAKQALEAYEALKEEGYKNKLVSIGSIKPIDKEGLLKIASEVKGIVTVENHTINGGLAGAVSEVLMENGASVKFRRVGVMDRFTESGVTKDVKAKYGICKEHIVEVVKSIG
ncbi:MAG: transketolase family protein [Fusobacterium sp.]